MFRLGWFEPIQPYVLVKIKTEVYFKFSSECIASFAHASALTSAYPLLAQCHNLLPVFHSKHVTYHYR
jgi:hypothetical protein